MSRSCLFSIFAVVIALCSTASADYKADIGYTRLASELGGAVPTGSGVDVLMVEGLQDNNYMPDVNHTDLVGKTITAKSGSSGISYHATAVARYISGATLSIAPGVNTIDVYSTNDFLGTSFLNVGGVGAPATSSRKVWNHSWGGDYGSASTNLNALKRLDWSVANSGAVCVVGMNNGYTNLPLLNHAMNVISVGRSDGYHSRGTISLSDPNNVYVAGRTKPDLVAPLTATSWATPVVSASSALLIETGVSMGSTAAQKPQVIKASLMSGANRWALSNYSVNTSNGLSSVYGAGQLDIYESYHIINGGQQRSQQAGGPAYVSQYGFDFGAGFSNAAVATYRFTADTMQNMLTASLVWNVNIQGGSGPSWKDTATLANFGLSLHEVGAGGNTLVMSSNSVIDNTENIWATYLTPGTDYIMQVQRSDSLGNWDYGLSWRLGYGPGSIIGDVNLDGIVDDNDINAVIAAGKYDTGYSSSINWFHGDMNRDGKVDFDDMYMIMVSGNYQPSSDENLLALVMSDSSLMADPSMTIPEPASASMLLACGMAALIRRRR